MDLEDFLRSHGRCASRHDLIGLLGRHRFDNLVKTGELVAVFARTYARPWDVDLLDVRQTAALCSVGGHVGLSHLTALDRWRLPVPAAPIHVTAYNPRHPRGVADELVVHRTLLPLDVVERDGLPVVRPELAIVTSWPLLDGSAQRAPLIEAAQRRLVRADRIADLAERMWWIAGRAALKEVVGLLLAGCQSPLEMYGYTDVFNVPGLDDASRQRRVRVGVKTYWLDQVYDDAMLNIELDGRKFHSSEEQREADIARDAAVATVGWLTLRFSHDRLHRDVDGCRRDAVAVRAVRRQQRLVS